MKCCIKCGKNEHYAKGLCKKCWRAARYKKNRVKIKLRQAEWKKANPEYYKKWAETHSSYNPAWHVANRELQKRRCTEWNRAHGAKPMSENKECGVFLGVHVAERVLRNVFENVTQMPYKNRGYDFICNKGKKIDVKSSCIIRGSRWQFAINENTIADYFLCIAFDDRDKLNPLYLWLIPGNVINHLKCTSISESTINKWGAHRLEIDKVISCCDTLRK